MKCIATFQIEEFGKTESKDLKPGGHSIPVTEANKREYVQLACQMKMTGSIRAQIKSFLEGFYEVIPKELISIFNEQELELLISGLPTIDIDDLKANTEYHKYTESSLQVWDLINYDLTRFMIIEKDVISVSVHLWIATTVALCVFFLGGGGGLSLQKLAQFTMSCILFSLLCHVKK